MSDSLQSINNLQAFGNDNNLKHNVAFNSIMNQHMTGVPRPLTSDAQKTDLDKEKEIEKDLDKYFDIMNTKSEETLDPKSKQKKHQNIFKKRLILTNFFIKFIQIIIIYSLMICSLQTIIQT